MRRYIASLPPTMPACQESNIQNSCDDYESPFNTVEREDERHRHSREVEVDPACILVHSSPNYLLEEI